jgi:hypothetical protein
LNRRHILQRIQRRLHKVRKHLLLIRKVAVESSGSHAGRRSDSPHGSVLKPILQKFLFGGRYNTGMTGAFILRQNLASRQ